MQMKIALRSPDPLVLYKCWLFVAMSFIQQEDFKKARDIIKSVFFQVKSVHEDKTLVCMCRGIWARLKYYWDKSKEKKNV